MASFLPDIGMTILWYLHTDTGKNGIRTHYIKEFWQKA